MSEEQQAVEPSSAGNLDQEFVDTLESFRDLKSGISGSRIKKLTTYALENVAHEATLISAVVNYSKTCADSHKLGSLYIIDSIGRAYLNVARSHDDYIKPSAKPGTCAHALYVLGQSVQELLADAISKSTDDHKDKIRMLIDIWDKSGLFQKGILNAVRAKWFSMDSNYGENNNNNNASQDDPKAKADTILSNLVPAQSIPSVAIPPALSSTDMTEVKSAVSQLLISIHSQPGTFIRNSTPSQTRTHVTAEYGSRRERERERERYSSRRNRSRSPRRDSQLAESSSSSSGSTNSSSHGGMAMNNHHLYPDEMNVPTNPHHRPKNVSFDATLPKDHIKVYSRTLFLGGVPMNMKEWDIANILRPFAEVQSVILNNGRKHAFVKVYSRSEAENALLNFNKDGSSPLRTRWGVGFGPRDCCDYQHGYSIIPIHRLTDADQKWSVSAQWGGTNGEPLRTGLVFEEPDIIVGDGVSSKAISQKMPTDSGKNGPRSGKGAEETAAYNTLSPPPQPYAQMAQPHHQYPYPQAAILPPQPMAIAGYNSQPSEVVAQPQQQQQQQQQSQPFDPTAHLNSLVSMLNQQQQ